MKLKVICQRTGISIVLFHCKIFNYNGKWNEITNKRNKYLNHILRSQISQMQVEQVQVLMEFKTKTINKSMRYKNNTYNVTAIHHILNVL